MSGITQRVLELNLPLDQVVVIGSGVLDALDLRSAGDVDLVVSQDVFDSLTSADGWTLGEKHNKPIAQRGDVEVFLSWGNDGIPNFESLFADSLVVEGVHFADPQFVIDWKQGRGTDKDLRDIALLKEYLADER